MSILFVSPNEEVTEGHGWVSLLWDVRWTSGAGLRALELLSSLSGVEGPYELISRWKGKGSLDLISPRQRGSIRARDDSLVAMLHLRFAQGQASLMSEKYDSHPSRPDLLLDAVAIEIFSQQVPEHSGMLSPSGKRVK